jgi:hypothetical protein
MARKCKLPTSPPPQRNAASIGTPTGNCSDNGVFYPTPRSGVGGRATVNCISAVGKRTPPWLGRHGKISVPCSVPKQANQVTLGEISSRNATVSDWGYVGCFQFGQFVSAGGSFSVNQNHHPNCNLPGICPFCASKTWCENSAEHGKVAVR